MELQEIFKRACPVILAAALLCGTSPSASAGFLGNQLRLERDPPHPTNPSILDVLVVDPGVEAQDFPASNFWDVDVADTTIVITELLDGFFLSGFFNGIRFSDFAGGIEPISSVSVSSTIPGMDSSRIAWDADNISVDYAGISVLENAQTTLTVTFVPEPGTLSLLALGGLVCLGRLRRRRSSI